MNPASRLLLGFLAGVLSVLTFHQGMIALLHVVNIPAIHVSQPPYRLTPVPPWGVPRLVDLCFWGGLYGALFGILHAKARPGIVFNGFLLGILAVLVGFFVVAPLKNQPIGGGWAIDAWLRSILINGSFGIGVGIIYPMMGLRRS